MTSTTLVIPPEIVPTVHRGALNELRSAAHATLALCEPCSEKPEGDNRDTFDGTSEHFVAAHGLLADIGYDLPEHPTAVKINLVKHLWILLRVMGGQRQADIELAVDMDPAEQSAAARRIRILEDLINAFAAEYA